MEKSRFQKDGSYVSVHGVPELGGEPSPVFLILREAMSLITAGVRVEFNGVRPATIQNLLALVSNISRPQLLTRDRVVTILKVWRAIEALQGKRLTPAQEAAITNFANSAAGILGPR